MYQTCIQIPAELAEALEAFFCEEPQEHWVLYEETRLKTHELQGYFMDQAEAEKGYAVLRAQFPELPQVGTGGVLEDKDWKEAYKLHFKAWSDRGLHFVPEWERNSYVLPVGDAMILLDPGMAFGTGNHETTRLCIRRILDTRELWGSARADKRIIDAGCGSGILAIAAKKVGFGPTFAFDNDPDSVRISEENATLCGLPGGVDFCWCGLEEGLGKRQADLVLANILAPVLIEHADLLLHAVASGGRLALSGILVKEVEAVRAHFAPAAERIWGVPATIDQREDGEWADLLLVR